MKDLRDVIKKLITTATLVSLEHKGPPRCIEKRFSVDYYTFRELVAEYNIAFVEPEEEQTPLPPQVPAMGD